MNTSVPIQYHRGLRCFDSCLVYALETRRIPVSPLLIRCLTLAWDREEDLLGRKIRFDQGIEEMASLFRLWERGEAIPYSSLPDSARWILLHLDAYYCPWHRVYREQHTDHYCMVISGNGEGFTCVDPMMSDKPQFLKKSLAGEGYLEAWQPAIAGQAGTDLAKRARILAGRHLRKQKELLPGWAEAFCRACDETDLIAEFEGLEKGTYDVPLYRNLWQLGAGHGLLAEFICGSFGEEGKNVIQMLENTGNQWEEYRKTRARDYLLSYKRKKKQSLVPPDAALLKNEAACLDACLDLLCKEAGL